MVSQSQHSEFGLIARYFTPSPPSRDAGVALGVGDDCTLLLPAAGQQLAVSVDTSVAGVHYPADAPADAVGHRALAVSLSDLAAMGARARWCLMALTLEEADEAWLAGFSRGFRDLAEASGTALVGGDVTRGATAIGVTVMGEVAPEAALTRHGGRPGDLVAVTGALGGGAGGLALWQRGERDPSHPLLIRYLRPQPRLAAGEALAGLATAAIDISDGLLADLGHVLAASGVGAELWVDRLPRSDAFHAVRHAGHIDEADWYGLVLAGGDDYELCFTAPPAREETIRAALAASGVAVTAVGGIEVEHGLRCRHDDGTEYRPPREGYQHFS